jgi:hypothetical protein
MHTATRTAARNAWLMIALLTVASPGLVRADDRFYVGPHNGLWSDPANWSATSGGAGGAGVPVAGDRAFLDNATTANIAVTLDVNYAGELALLSLDGTNGFSNTIFQNHVSAFDMATVNTFVGNTGSGRYVHSTGRHTVGSYFLILLGSVHTRGRNLQPAQNEF